MNSDTEKRKIWGYYIEDIPKYLKRYTSYVFIFPIKYFPESPFKKYVRKSLLKFYNSVPLFLAVNKGDTAIQVGTPNTRTLDRFSRLVGRYGKVYIIEADKDNVKTLSDYKSEKEIQNVTLVPLAAWSEKRTLTFFLSDIRNGDHKVPVDGVLVDNDFTNNYQRVEIPADTLDNMMKNLGVDKFNYLSVTVNGAELEVLKGAKGLIMNSNNSRIYSKGHSLIRGVPLNEMILQYLSKFKKHKIVISKGEMSNSEQENWKRRAGDVFAWTE